MSKDVHIGTIDNKKIYLIWQDVKDICNNEVRKENEKLKELLKECVGELAEFNNSYYPKIQALITKIDEALK